MPFTAKDVQSLRQATGAGMMDSKKALEANDGDLEAAAKWLREQGLAASAKRADRDNTQGVVALHVAGAVGAIVELKCETDFVAGSDQFKAEADTLAKLVVAGDERSVESRKAELDDLKITLKENIELGRVVRLAGRRRARSSTATSTCRAAAASTACSSCSPAATPQLAHDIAVHIAFARPKYLTRDEVPADVVAAERDDARDDQPQRGQARSGAAEDHRGPHAGLLQGHRAARPALRQGRQAVDRPAPRRRRASSASPRSRSAERR